MLRTALSTACAALIISAIAVNAAHADKAIVELPPVRFAPAVAKPGSNIPHDLVGDVATATIELHEALFRKIANAVLPAIIAEAKTLRIPGQSQKHFSYGTIELSEFGLGTVAINFAAPNQVVVTVAGLSLAVPSTAFSVFAKVLFVHLRCSGTFDVSLSDTDATITFALTENAGVLGVEDISAAVRFGSLNIQHSFHNFFCKVGQDIISLFVGNIDHVIRNAVEKDISPIMTKALSKAFAAVAAKMKLPLVSAPVATANSISFDVDLLHRVPPQAAAKQLHHRQPRHHARRGINSLRGAAPQLRNSTFPSRDIELFVPQTSVDVILADVQQSGALKRTVTLNKTTAMLRQLIPAAYAACPDCPLQININVLSPPAAQFAGSAALAVTNAELGVNAVNGTQTVDLVDLLVNATVVAQNFTAGGALDNVIKFGIGIPVFGMSLYRSAIGPIDTSLLTWLANTAIQDFIVPDFNKNFQGLPIPPIANVTVSAIELSFEGAADVGLDITLPPL